MRVRLIADDQYGPDGPKTGDEGFAFGHAYDEFEKWYFIHFDDYGSDTYYTASQDMIEVIDEVETN